MKTNPTTFIRSTLGDIRTLLYYATLAPNSHNTQPWKFSTQDCTIRIFPDYSRRLPVNDPNDRELYISLGCGLENLVIAASFLGYESEVTYFPKGEEECLRVDLIHTRKVEDPLFAAIPVRQCTRNEYNRQRVPTNDLKKLEELHTADGVSALLFTDHNQVETLVEYVMEGDKHQYASQAFIDELVHWIRFNKSEAVKTLDGMYAPCAGNPTVPRWIGKRFVTTKSGGQQVEKDARQIQNSAGVLMVVTEADNRCAWVNAGRTCERFMLTMICLNIKLAFMNQPIQVTELRPQLASALSLGNLHPQVMLRFGFGKEMPRSLRRPAEQLLI